MGIVRGVQLMADFVALLLLAFEQGNPNALRDCIGVATTWRRETVDIGGRVRHSAWALAFADPWKGSRSMLRLVQEKWKGRM